MKRETVITTGSTEKDANTRSGTIHRWLREAKTVLFNVARARAQATC